MPFVRTPATVRTNLAYAANLAVTVLIAMLCFCPVGAFVPKQRRNPVAKIGLPEVVVKEKKQKLERVLIKNELLDG